MIFKAEEPDLQPQKKGLIANGNLSICKKPAEYDNLFLKRFFSPSGPDVVSSTTTSNLIESIFGKLKTNSTFVKSYTKAYQDIIEHGVENGVKHINTNSYTAIK